MSEPNPALHLTPPSDLRCGAHCMMAVQVSYLFGGGGLRVANWYYTSGVTRLGPVSDAELRALAANGKVRPSDLVWRKGMSEWVPASRIKGLCPVTDEPPPLPTPLSLPDDKRPVSRATTSPRRRHREEVEPVLVWEAWQIWLFSIISLGLFELYLVPSWAQEMERITGKRRLPFGVLLLLGVVTLGVALAVVHVIYAFELERHGRECGRRGSRPQLGAWVLSFNVVALVWSLATAGIGFLLGGFILNTAALWLMQSELNSYSVTPEAEPGAAPDTAM
ncbi:DUF4339 domain-containing protein [Gemmata sp. JC717]|uniref:DUF4339 domain-containing protein n=1 Tax=Gemmata algarum TaxID=2975278 RepID=UPI0021BA4679|nr:DUF4339 domain-containing protein [Gemmata algarum]MDY3555836.1 DUF4339 domain-containing protein [Gemmata algarum]